MFPRPTWLTLRAMHKAARWKDQGPDLCAPADSCPLHKFHFLLHLPLSPPVFLLPFST